MLLRVGVEAEIISLVQLEENLQMGKWSHQAETNMII